MSAALVAGLASANAQVVAADSVMQHVNGKRLSIGGYGEVAFSRNFYSDSGNRYSSASLHKNDPSHGRFDIPHAVIYLGYDFGKGWTFGTEIEFEHGGTGSAIEYEAEESIEFEQEQEKAGEVELEQFWIQKSFGKFLNIRAGHIVVPVGLTNAYHEPLNFFTVSFVIRLGGSGASFLRDFQIVFFIILLLIRGRIDHILQLVIGILWMINVIYHEISHKCLNDDGPEMKYFTKEPWYIITNVLYLR